MFARNVHETKTFSFSSVSFLRRVTLLITLKPVVRILFRRVSSSRIFKMVSWFSLSRGQRCFFSFLLPFVTHVFRSHAHSGESDVRVKISQCIVCLFIRLLVFLWHLVHSIYMWLLGVYNSLKRKKNN